MIWKPGANVAGATATLLLGTGCGIELFLANVVFHWVHLHFLYATPALLLIDSSILVGVSLCTRRPAGPIDSVIWTTAFFRAESERLRKVPIWRNYRMQGAVLLILTACVVVVFH